MNTRPSDVKTLYLENQQYLDNKFLEDLTEEIKIARRNKWDGAYAVSSNEKLIIHSAMVFLIRELKLSALDMPPLTLDLGCGLGVLFAQSLQVYYPEMRYLGVKPDAEWIMQANKLAEDFNISNSKFIALDYFAEDLSRLANKNGLISAIHVGYEVPDPQQFINYILSNFMHGEKTAAVFVHRCYAQEYNLLAIRQKYSRVAHKDLGIMTIETSESLGLDCYTVALYPVLEFPHNMTELWDTLAECRYGQNSIRYSYNYELAKHLLEYIIGEPLETLAAKSLLHNYLAEMRQLLEQYDNKLAMSVELQIVVPQSATSSHCFGSSIWEDIATKLERKFYVDLQLA